VIVDVFADRALEGNQLAVVTDAGDITSEEMQALARETRLSETTFVLPKGDAAGATRVRIFTVNEELPFAGHPTLGTAYVLHRRQKNARVVLNLNVGLVPVVFSDSGGRSFGEMTQRDPEFGETYTSEDVASALGLAVDDISSDLPIQCVSTGMPFAIVPIRSLDVTRRMNPSWASIANFVERRQAKFLYFVTRDTVDPNATLHARMFFYGGEDPATGSAAGCCTGWAVAHGVLAPEKHGLIEQGLEMLRPSKIYIRGSLEQGTVKNVRVGGYCVEVARGEFYLPK
jgi:trans-2,3-dihydro-3-hydroxyanthranilate isomerase